MLDVQGTVGSLCPERSRDTEGLEPGVGNPRKGVRVGFNEAIDRCCRDYSSGLGFS